ncbi:hypothetical protein HK104_008064, partial [Borealophlyctis nickersoniae]
KNPPPKKSTIALIPHRKKIPITTFGTKLVPTTTFKTIKKKVPVTKKVAYWVKKYRIVKTFKVVEEKVPVKGFVKVPVKHTKVAVVTVPKAVKKTVPVKKGGYGDGGEIGGGYADGGYGAG